MPAVQYIEKRMKKRILLISVFLIVFVRVGFTQVERYHLKTFDNEFYSEKMQFRGSFGYYLGSDEFVHVDTAFFTDLINNRKVPTVNLVPALYIGSIGLMFNRIYTNVCYSYTPDKEKENDSLKSVLRQSSYSLNLGYNIYREKWVRRSISKKDSSVRINKYACVISPYFGIKVFRLRHITSINEKRITLQQYIDNPGYDIRVIQVSCPIGVNMTFNFDERYSFGFYVSYLYNLSEHPAIRSQRNRISTTAGLPIANFCFGLGVGFGFNDFYKKQNHKNDSYNQGYGYQN
jgi:hypothetical protein